MGFDTVLVANRGEIACRILRAARELGYRTVAIHSTVDAQAAHVALAHDAICVGAASAADSYLDVGRIVDAARSVGADAIHPGYGFLSENAAFAEACAAAGITFVGPPPDAIRAMGDKGRARQLMVAAGVACVPGYDAADRSDAALAAAADALGYPIMIKAVAGGGGRGMRRVDTAAELPSALALARAESRAAFGSDALILERAIVAPRHVEIQILADAHGAVIHLGERDCSIQRRHQKIIEEAPCPVMTGALRERMGAAAIQAARAVAYEGAGTVEFLLDAGNNFHFLEMNTRLQVEHPVTEAVTGLDLVALQFLVAEGAALPLTQDEVRITGHAIEARLYAEDPARDFMPATGRIALWEAPRGAGIRVDTGVMTGSEVTPFYDPMLAKIIASGPTREVARRRLTAALAELGCLGVGTNQDFLLDAISTDSFAAGEATTGFIDACYPAGFAPDPVLLPMVLAIGAVLDHLAARDASRASSPGVCAELLDWHSSGNAQSFVRYELSEMLLCVSPRGDAIFDVTVDGDRVMLRLCKREADKAEFEHEGRRIPVRFAWTDGTLHLRAPGQTVSLVNRLGGSDAESGSVDGSLRAPMHGVIRAIEVAVGDEVDAGAPLGMLEAMKMQHEICAPQAGRVSAVHVLVGQQVAAGLLLFAIELKDS